MAGTNGTKYHLRYIFYSTARVGSKEEEDLIQISLPFSKMEFRQHSDPAFADFRFRFQILKTFPFPEMYEESGLQVGRDATSFATIRAPVYQARYCAVIFQRRI